MEGAPIVRLFSWAEIVMFPQLVACCNVDYDLFRHTLENTRLSSLLFSGRIRYASKWDIYRNTFTFLYFFLLTFFLIFITFVCDSYSHAWQFFAGNLCREQGMAAHAEPYERRVLGG